MSLTFREAVSVVAKATGAPAGHVHHLARKLQEADLLPTSAGGRKSPRMTSEQLAGLLVGVAADPPLREASKVVGRLLGLQLENVAPRPGSPPPTFGRIVAGILSTRSHSARLTIDLDGCTAAIDRWGDARLEFGLAAHRPRLQRACIICADVLRAISPNQETNA